MHLLSLLSALLRLFRSGHLQAGRRDGPCVHGSSELVVQHGTLTEVLVADGLALAALSPFRRLLSLEFLLIVGTNTKGRGGAPWLRFTHQFAEILG